MYFGRIFIYLVNIDVEINNRILLVSSMFGGFREEVLERRGISLVIKF